MSDIQLQVSGKQIDTIPIINLLRQGENNADTILMQLPPKYGDIALDGLTYIMYGDSKSGTRATQVLEKEVNSEGVLLRWKIADDFTAVAGELKLMLKGFLPDRNPIIKWVGGTINVYCDPAGGLYPPPVSEIEQALKEMYAVLGKAEQSAQSAATSEKNAQNSAENARNSADNAQGSATKAEQIAQSVQGEAQKIEQATQAGIAAIDGAGKEAISNIQLAGEGEVSKITAAGSAEVQKVATEGAKQVQAATKQANLAKQSADSAASKVQEVAESVTAGKQEIATAKDAAVSAVQGEGSKQVQAVSSAGTAQVQAVNDAGKVQISAIGSEGTKQSKAVADAGAAQVQAISTEGQKQVAAVTAEGQKQAEEIKAIESLLPVPTEQDKGKVPMVNPEGNGYELGEVVVDAYTKAESDKRYMPLAVGIKPTVSGELITLTDSADFALQGLKIYGKSTQDGEPTPESPIPIVSVGEGGSVDVSITEENVITRPYIGFSGLAGESGEAKGIKVTIDDMGRIHFDGTATSKVTYRVRTGSLPEGSYTGAVFCDKENSGITLNWYFVTSVWGETNKFRATSKKNYRLEMSIAEGTVCDDIVVSPVLVSGTFDAIGYIPPQSQSLPIPTPNGLPGIPVKNGGNYTDSKGQQWVCDEIDFARDKWMQRVRKVKLSDLSWKMQITQNNKNYNFNGSLRPQDAHEKSIPSICTILPFKDIAWDGEPSTLPKAYCRGYNATVSFPPDSPINSLEIFQNLISETSAEIIYLLATPIEHDLSPELLAAYQKLHTYYPTTNLFASDNAGLEVQYLADTKNYIDNKIQSLTQAVIGGI